MDLNREYEVVRHEGIVKSSLKDLLSGSDKTVLYFYPRDNTPGCTVEAKDFTCLAPEFESLGYQIIGVSKDSAASHAKFIEKQALWLDLISDPELLLHKELWAYWEKNNYGKIVQWVIRSTFILDKDGNILKEYRNVRAKGHADRVLKEVEEL